MRKLIKENEHPPNPITYFSGGGSMDDMDSFNYEAGDKAYYVHAATTSWIPVSILIFANDKEQVEKIFDSMLKFIINCCKNQIKYKNKSGYFYQDQYRESKTIKHCEELLERKPPWNISIKEAPTNQIYKVGWASNDTLAL